MKIVVDDIEYDFVSQSAQNGEITVKKDGEERSFAVDCLKLVAKKFVMVEKVGFE